MIDAKTPEGRLAQVRHHFDRYMDHWRKCRLLQLRDANFYHDVDGVSQWDAEALKILQDQNRPALSFNLIAFKVNQAIGLHEEHRHEPKVVPVSGTAKDLAIAGILDALLYRAREDMDQEELDSQVYEGGIVMGEADLALETRPMKDGPPEWMSLNGEVIQCTSVMWDPSSEYRDRKDAMGMFWHKWVELDRFIATYPEHKDKAKQMFGSGPWEPEVPIEDQSNEPERDYTESNAEYYVNRKERKLCVIHFEYFCIKPRYWLNDYAMQDGQEIDEEFAKGIEEAKNKGDERFGDVEVITEYVEYWNWVECIGNTLLFEGESKEPYPGFTVTPFIAYQDTVTGWPYGIVRHMIDPQRDVNKAHSQSLDHLNTQSKPGWLAEKSAIPDKEAFEESNATASSVAIVEDGALTQQRVIARQVPVYSEAANARLDRAIQLLHLVSGISSDPEDANRGVETATAIGIKERKALRSLTRVLRSFERYQKRVAKKKLTAILTVFPDEQITAWLSADGKFSVQGGTVIQMVEQEDGSFQPMPLVNIRDLRQVYYSIGLETTTQSDTERLIALHSVITLIQSGAQAQGIPIDPAMVYDLIAPNRSYRERLKEHGKQTMRSMSQSQKENMQIQLGQLRAEHAKEQKKLEIEQGKAMADVKLKAKQQRADAIFDFLDLWQQAEDNEKKYIADLAKTLIQDDMKREEARERATERTEGAPSVA